MSHDNNSGLKSIFDPGLPSAIGSGAGNSMFSGLSSELVATSFVDLLIKVSKTQRLPPNTN